jgi:hypothetical protein
MNNPPAFPTIVLEIFLYVFITIVGFITGACLDGAHVASHPSSFWLIGYITGVIAMLAGRRKKQ